MAGMRAGQVVTGGIRLDRLKTVVNWKDVVAAAGWRAPRLPVCHHRRFVSVKKKKEKERENITKLPS